MGRPTDYTIELGKRICQEIATKTISLKRICTENEDFPHKSTVYDWILKHKEFADLYARAREAQADTMFDEIIEIADDSQGDNEVRYSASGEPYTTENKEYTSRSKLRVDARKWAASKLNAKKYGDKTDITTGGESITNIKIGYGPKSDD